ncbi:MAG TPA: hypothetical protein VGB24_05435 [Longimicrobium sp.]|jgi:hypothetical protein|uniref:hypothetical protein n=1 Tax=Longimicrobium sp. TaxID=2029185 RepID=UPI002ED7D5A9
MLKKTKALGVASILAFAAACDMPTEPDVLMQVARWNGNVMSSPVGYDFDIEVVLKQDIDAATSETAGVILAVWQVAGAGNWMGRCVSPGTDIITIFFPDNTRGTYLVECGTVETLTGLLARPRNIGAYLGEPTSTVQFVAGAQELWRRIVDGQTEVTCTELGIYQYIMVTAPDGAHTWYQYECVEGIPLPVPPPRVLVVTNLSEAFRAQGRALQAVQVWPSDLATGVVINNMVAPSVAAPPAQSTAPRASTGVADDVGLRCERTGRGTITLTFAGSAPGTADYALTCHPVHEQGSGG